LPSQYYIRTRGVVRGPFPPEKLKELARRGQFSRAYHVSVDGESWEPAANHPELLPEAIAVKIRKQPVETDSEDSGYDLAEPPSQDVETGASTTNADQSFDSANWYFASGGQESGPVSFTELRRLVLRGELHYNDPVWTEGMADWIEALSVPELFAEPSPEESAAISAGHPMDDTAPLPTATSPLAIASLISGILGLTICGGVGSIAAVILGHIAAGRIQASGDTLGGRGLAKTGLILGYVGIGIAVLVLVFGLGILAMGILSGIPE
jgi:hypothetical protein